MKKPPEGQQPDRVWFAETFRINLGNFEHIETSAGVASDVQSAESTEEALERCKRETLRLLNRRSKILTKKHGL